MSKDVEKAPENIAEVGTYALSASNGRRIARKYTMVALANGAEVKFLGRLGKREAIRQALQIASNDRAMVKP